MPSALPRRCPRPRNRRFWLKVGGLSLGALTTGASPNLARLIAAEQAGPLSNEVDPDFSVILFWANGGPSHLDLFDLKPQAPAEYRGPFRPIATNVPGTIVTDQLPHCAKIADKYTIVRSHSHRDNGHSTGYHYVMTGRRANFSDGDNPVPNNAFYPSIGSVVSRELGQKGALPPYINLPHPMAGGGPGFYGAEYAPFVIDADPTQPDFEVKDLSPPGKLKQSRLSTRQKLLAGIDELERERNRGGAREMSTYYEKAYSLITSADARKAFDINSEPDKVRDAYGRTQIGQCALLARRLIEAGGRFVGVDAPGWDVHYNCFPSLQTDLIPYADLAFSALVTDLEERGLLDDTLVVMMGEMGRPPRINSRAGRDHWSAAQTIIFAGGGVKPGQIIGATDKTAAAPTTDPVSVSDLLRTISNLMGIDADRTYLGPLGRPVPIVDGGKFIEKLV